MISPGRGHWKTMGIFKAEDLWKHNQLGRKDWYAEWTYLVLHTISLKISSCPWMSVTGMVEHHRIVHAYHLIHLQNINLLLVLRVSKLVLFNNDKRDVTFQLHLQKKLLPVDSVFAGAKCLRPSSKSLQIKEENSDFFHAPATTEIMCRWGTYYSDMLWILVYHMCQ